MPTPPRCWKPIYRNGLGEFAYRNGLDLHGRIRFPRDARAVAARARRSACASTRWSPSAAARIRWSASRRCAPPASSRRSTWIGGSQLIAACAARTGLPTLNIGRQLAPQLFEFNRQGAWNGHIPVTAVNSAILAFAAVLHGRRPGGVLQRALGQLRLA